MGKLSGSSLLPLWLAFSYFGFVQSISPISIKGTKLYDDNGNQFYIKGVAYSAGNLWTDLLLSTAQCQIDAGLMKAIGVNTIRVYAVDGKSNHDGCMQAFASQGIYVWLGLPGRLEANSPATSGWTMELYNNWTGIVDAFAGYDNLLTFTVGSAVLSEPLGTSVAAPYIKAAARDIKAFRDLRGYRPIPISYTASDTISTRNITANYLACGDRASAIELYGMNAFSWCDNSSYYLSGYDKFYEDFQAFDVPVLLSETGCKINNGTRDFASVSTMLGPIFQAVFSGAIVYEWAQEENNYGLVRYDNDMNTGFPTTLDDYNALSTVFGVRSPTGTPRAAYTPSNLPPACPTSDAKFWWVDSSSPLPTIAGLKLETVTARTTYTSRNPTGITSSAPNTPDPGSELRTAAKAGIAVGSAIAALGLIGIGGFVFLRKRRRTTEPSCSSPGDTDNFKAELPAKSIGTVVPRQEMDAAPGAQEVEGREVSAEPDYAGKRQEHPHEMEGSVPPVSELASPAYPTR